MKVDKKDYAVDIVLNTLQDLSLAKVHYFQRDGSFFAVSKEGFGFLTLGLPLYDSHRARDPTVEEVFANSENLLVSTKKGEEENKLSEKQRKYVEPLLFGEDSQGFSLKSMRATAEKLDSLPNDGLVRLIDHDSRYHSHKHGYACDGTDVWVSSARSMPKEKFLNFIRRSEDFIFERLKKDLDKTRFAYAASGSYYEGEEFRIPKFGIVTSSMLLHMPRPARIDYHHPDELWTEDTVFSSSGRLSNEFLVSNETETSKRSPFTIGLVLNHKRVDLTKPKETARDLREYQKQHSANQFALYENLPAMRSYLHRLNVAHNEVFKKEIEERESFRRRLR